jgi:hypothetical protein
MPPSPPFPPPRPRDARGPAALALGDDGLLSFETLVARDAPLGAAYCAAPAGVTLPAGSGAAFNASLAGGLAGGAAGLAARGANATCAVSYLAPGALAPWAGANYAPLNLAAWGFWHVWLYPGAALALTLPPRANLTLAASVYSVELADASGYANPTSSGLFDARLPCLLRVDADELDAAALGPFALPPYDMANLTSGAFSALGGRALLTNVGPGIVALDALAFLDGDNVVDLPSPAPPAPPAGSAESLPANTSFTPSLDAASVPFGAALNFTHAPPPGVALQPVLTRACFFESDPGEFESATVPAGAALDETFCDAQQALACADLVHLPSQVYDVADVSVAPGAPLGISASLLRAVANATSHAWRAFPVEPGATYETATPDGGYSLTFLHADPAWGNATLRLCALASAVSGAPGARRRALQDGQAYVFVSTPPLLLQPAPPPPPPPAPPAPPAGGAEKSGAAPAPAPWYILLMIGLQMASTSFSLSSNSSASASWLASSHWMASSMTFSMAFLSSSGSLTPESRTVLRMLYA